MSPFVVMALTGLGAGLLVPLIAIAAAKLGLCEPFSLHIAGHKWTFARRQHTFTANTSVRVENHMPDEYAFSTYVRCVNTITRIAA